MNFGLNKSHYHKSVSYHRERKSKEKIIKLLSVFTQTPISCLFTNSNLQTLVNIFRVVINKKYVRTLQRVCLDEACLYKRDNKFNLVVFVILLLLICQFTILAVVIIIAEVLLGVSRCQQVVADLQWSRCDSSKCLYQYILLIQLLATSSRLSPHYKDVVKCH